MMTHCLACCDEVTCTAYACAKFAGHRAVLAREGNVQANNTVVQSVQGPTELVLRPGKCSSSPAAQQDCSSYQALQPSLGDAK